MTGTIVAHYRGIRKLRGEGLCIVCKAEHFRLGLSITLEFNTRHFGSERESRFLDFAQNDNEKMGNGNVYATRDGAHRKT
jgi:hypothetical protein